MYSRYHGNQDASIQIPENYSGCAFMDTHTPPARHFIPPEGARKMEVATPSITRQEPPAHLAPTDETGGKEDAHREGVASCHALIPNDPPPHTAPSILRGIGFEELLLLGLIVLLSNHESANELVLWLVLLLFVG